MTPIEYLKTHGDTVKWMLADPKRIGELHSEADSQLQWMLLDKIIDYLVERDGK